MPAASQKPVSSAETAQRATPTARATQKKDPLTARVARQETRHLEDRKKLEEEIRALRARVRALEPLEKRLGGLEADFDALEKAFKDAARRLRAASQAAERVTRRLPRTEQSLRKRLTALERRVSKDLRSLNARTRVTTTHADLISELDKRVTNLQKLVSVEVENALARMEEKAAQLVRTTTTRKTTVPPFSKPEEELAHDIMALYFAEIARQGFKRTLTLDDIINTYLYTLSKIRGLVGTPQEAILEEKTEAVEEKPQPAPEPKAAPALVTGFSYTNKKGTTYYLHKRGRLYYFSRKEMGSVPLPEGFRVVESEKTGLPFLRKK